MKKINIHGVIGLDARSSDIIKQIEDAADEDKVFEIHSPGGSVMEGLAIYNAIRQARGNSSMRVLGLAASMASIIAMAKGKPEVAKRSIFMIHNAQMFAQGDYQVLQKAADLSNKVSDMMASIYAENSKKSKKSIREMMDKETYMFGEQIKNEGFAKTVYDDEKEEKEEDAYAMAQLEIEECIKKMTGFKEDFAMTAQMIETFTAENKSEQNPATKARENNITEVLKMNLKEILDQNPAAKTEYDAALQASFNAGKKEVRDIIAKASPFMNNADYPKPVSDMAMSVIKGDKSVDILDTMAASVDMWKELKKSEIAKTEGKNDIPAVDPKTGLSAEYQKTGMIMTQADMEAEIAAKSKELGLEVK